MTAHVLVVEDSELVVAAMRIILESAGFRVSVASSVAATIEACGRDCPDVLLLDLSLPDGNGLAALETLREQGIRPRVVVAVTGRDEPRVRERCLRAGCREVLIKPIQVGALAAQIKGWMSDGAK